LKALTICQPYAELIMRGQKRVENRTWPTSYRGPLLIHAGKSKSWLSLDDVTLRDTAYDIPFHEMEFGAIIGVATLDLCVHISLTNAVKGYEWLRAHEHTNGPFCWVLSNVKRFDKPIPFRGRQQLFDVPNDLITEIPF
jgi:activating signal cointegrator 1